jgi:hypothetical protein
MAAVETPGLARDGFPDEKRASKGSFTDEKGLDLAEKVDLDNPEEVGEVFADGPRLIDLGEDGHERPIGASSTVPPFDRLTTHHRNGHRLCDPSYLAR